MNDIYNDTKNFWNEAPCGTSHLNHLFQKASREKYFETFDSYFWDKYPYLFNFLELEKMINKTVLEIGLGSGTTLGVECKFARKVYGLDLSDKTIELQEERKKIYALNNLNFINASATKIPLKDNSIDIVISIGCIHHIPDDKKVVSEIYRVLKPGGVFKGMVYYKHSFRALYKIPFYYMKQKRWKGKTRQQCINEVYDGSGNPYAALYSCLDVYKLLKKFKHKKFSIQNFPKDELGDYKDFISQETLHKTIGRLLGADLYFTAVK